MTNEYTEVNVLDDFDRLSPYISAALEYAGGSHTLDDIWRLVATHRLQLWPGQSSVVLTQILQSPQLRELHFFLAGGNLEEMKRLYPLILAWGREQGCSRATFTGRRGWERTFLTREEGWRAPMLLFEKDL